MFSLNDFERRELLERGFSEEEIKKAEDEIREHVYGLYGSWVKGYLITDRILSETFGEHKKVLGRLSLEKEAFRILAHARWALIWGIKREAIVSCRTALEVAYKDRISEKYAKQRAKNTEEFHKFYLEKMEELNNNLGMTLGNLYPMAEGKKWEILPKGTFEGEFQELGGLDILNKFVHGDVLWLAKFIEDDLVGMPINIMNANNEYERRRQIAELYGELFSPLPFEIFRATCRILKELYFEEDTKGGE